MVKNTTKTFRSRILQYFPVEALEEIKKLIYNNRINDINTKVERLMNILDSYDIDFDELGTGTNRTAIFIDGYVFKIALDKWGVRDNEQEFTLSEELQPYVIKVYECNSIIMVCEYVVVINREEFAEHKPQIRNILKDLSNEYLLGDIGTINKNFANWGYRDNHELVALDFAYIYRVIGDEMFCDACDIRPMLEYTPDFDKLTCPHCRKQFQFMDIRRKISKEMETRELELSKERAYKITKEKESVKLHDYDIDKTNDGETQAQTFKFNLGDYVTYKRRKEEEEMRRESRDNNAERKLVPFIDINSDPEQEEMDDFANEIQLLMMKKKGIIPEDYVEEEQEEMEDEDDNVINDIIYYNVTKQPIPREDVRQYLNEDDEHDEEDEDIMDEIRNLRKHDELIYITNGNKEKETEEEVQEETEQENEVDEEYSFNDMATEVAVEVAKELTPVEEVLEEQETVSNNIEITVETEEVIIEKETIVEEVEEVQYDGNLSLALDDEVKTTLKVSTDDDVNELKDDIMKMIARYMTKHNMDIKDLDLNVHIGVNRQEEPETIDEKTEDEEKTEEVEVIEDSITVPQIQIGSLVDHDKQEQERLERMINDYSADMFSGAGMEISLGDDDGEDLDYDEMLGDELLDLYKNY